MKTSTKAFYVMMAYIAILVAVMYGLNQVAQAQVVVTPAPVTCTTVCHPYLNTCSTICN